MPERRDAFVLPSSRTEALFGRYRQAVGAYSFQYIESDSFGRKKGLIERILGDDDKRQMYFSLTQEGERCLKELECCDVEIPDVLKKIL